MSRASSTRTASTLFSRTSDFEKIKSKKDKNITIEKFVNLSEVDPLYFDKPYYVAPTGAEKAFAVLLDGNGAGRQGGNSKDRSRHEGNAYSHKSERRADAVEHAFLRGRGNEEPRQRR